MTSTLDPRYISPNHQHVKNKIMLQYEIQKLLVAEELKNLNTKVALTWIFGPHLQSNSTLSNYTAEHTREKLFELCRNMNISEKREIGFGHYRCTAHILNIAVNHETNLLVTAHKNQFNYTYPNDYKWKRINILIDLLHPVLEATKYFSKECIVADSINYKLDKYWSLLNEKITIDTILDLLSKLKTFLPEENKTTSFFAEEQENKQQLEEELD
ncbi:hypothetical protein C2G38_2182169 [Gigaspora rosea]|uniref:Uncharacterized protein n=1 Tax=Gigaspora rosea TaxID=44941 RepID=A0A397VC85_9GLOM|nr:hypothetical protein C2G38_2182169 [Gigaspora rosea]